MAFSQSLFITLSVFLYVITIDTFMVVLILGRVIDLGLEKN